MWWEGGCSPSSCGLRRPAVVERAPGSAHGSCQAGCSQTKEREHRSWLFSESPEPLSCSTRAPLTLFPSRRTRAMLWHPLGLPWPCHPLHGAGKCPDLAMVGAAAPLLGRDGKRAVMLGSINTECVTLVDGSRSESGGLAERGRACSARGCCHQGWGRATQDTGAALTQDTL